MSSTSKLLRKHSPMLAYNGDWSFTDLRNEPYVISNKWDGQRALCRGGQLISRGSRQILNTHIRAMFEKLEHNGFDGEIIIPGCDGPTISGICRSKHDARGAQAWWLVFDDERDPRLPYGMRLAGLYERMDARGPRIEHRVQVTAQINYSDDPKIFEELEQELATYNMPFEGYMLRRVNSGYKHGRATLKEASLFKLTHDAYCEANIMDIHPRTTQDGTVLPEVGAFECVSDQFKSRFNVGTGWTRAQGAHWWSNPMVLGQRIRIAYKACGSGDAPRQPRYAGGIV